MIAGDPESPCNGLEIRSWSNGLVALAVAPELGGHLVSLRRAGGGREWLDGWSDHPARRRLWLPQDPADFASGCGAGLDECLPTVLPCTVDGRLLPDHGELWNKPAEIQPAIDGHGFKCVWVLECLPVRFTRQVVLDGHRVHFDYELANLVDSRTPFQWAWHPLFSLHDGDRLDLAEPTDRCTEPDGTGHPWPELRPGWDLSRATLDPGVPSCAKVFLGPMHRPSMSISNARDGQKLVIEWTGRWIPYAGVWITRGAWRNLHHWAIEPTNVPVDRLSDALADPRFDALTRLGPRESRRWRVTLTIA